MGSFHSVTNEATPGSVVGASAEQAAGILGAAKFLCVVVQLGLLALVLRQFQVESSAFLRIALLAFAGFTVHHFLPLSYRLPFFVLLSLAGVAMVFGMESGVWLIALGLALIGICHLPVSFRIRIALLLAAGFLLGFQRGGRLYAPWSPVIWPVLGSMFMFRLITYLYDLRYEKARVSGWRSAAYFFLLPNVCFPLFPVVDYKTFRRNYFDEEEYRIYQKGVDSMVRGVTHLISYRFIYYYAVLAPAEVVNPADLTRYLVSNFLLYLKVSGQFHLVIGMLQLFGFNLPRTNYFYCLSSSFTDFWRRINIYWKDFMMKVFYYPAYFKLRGYGNTKALVVSTLFVFAVTWFLHAYQWFWLRGSFLLVWQDVVFWGALALLVVVNSLYELKWGRKRILERSSWTVRDFADRALRTVGTFGVIVVLWSLWTSESFSSWLSLWAALGQAEISASVAVIPALLVAVVVLGAAGADGGSPDEGKGKLLLSRSTALTWISLLLLSSIGIPAVYTRLGPTVASMVVSLRSDKLSRLDVAALERGYYEDLTQVNRFNNELWEVYMNRPVEWLDVQGTGLARFTGDFLQQEMVPSMRSATRFGTISTNRWGMRDQDYERRPAPGTYRIAVLGASSVMGWGVGDDETFESLLEKRLQLELTEEPYTKYEILNFAVPGYYPLQQLPVLDKALSFEPNAVFYVATGRELSRAAFYLADVARKEIAVPYDHLRQIVYKAGIETGTSETDAVRRLTPFRPEITSWLYQSFVKNCREQGVLPVWVFLPQVNEGAWQEETAPAVQLAEDAGFIVINLEDVYRKQDIDSIRLADWDNHPNAQGHQLVAAALYQELRERREIFFSQPTARQE